MKLRRLLVLPLLSAAALIVIVATGFLSWAPVAYGQGITTGTITGTVVDPSGAAVPNARVLATNNSQGTQRETTSGSAGQFSLYSVPIGEYTLAISAPGFATATVNGLQVNSGATSGLKSVSLSLATAAAQVEVNGSAASLLQTTDSQVTTTFDAQAVQNIPLNNGFDTIAELIPGVVSTHAAGFSNTNGDNFSVNGQRGRANNFEIDGQSNNDNSISGPQVFFGNQDAIQEIQVVTDDFHAQVWPQRRLGGELPYQIRNQCLPRVGIRALQRLFSSVVRTAGEESTCRLLRSRGESIDRLPAGIRPPCRRESIWGHLRRSCNQGRAFFLRSTFLGPG